MLQCTRLRLQPMKLPWVMHSLERQTQKSVKKQKDLMERRRRARQMLNVVNEQLKAISNGLARTQQSIPNLNEQLESIKEGISENKTNAFSIRLPQNVSLTGSWRMALVQLTYPCTWRNVEQGHASALPDNFIELQLKAGGYLHFRVLPGYYATAEALAASIDLSLEKMLWQNNEWVPDLQPNGLYRKNHIFLHALYQCFSPLYH